jgi:hypothetical protein
MKRRLSVRELEFRAAALDRQDGQIISRNCGEAIAMLVRRGLQPSLAVNNDRFLRQLEPERADKLSGWLDHYAFRLFFRGRTAVAVTY